MSNKKNISKIVLNDKLSNELITQNMIEDMKSSLSKPCREISSSYLYDDKGSSLFQEIMQLPEYYLSTSEIRLLHEHKNTIISLLKQLFHGDFFHLIELGCGDGSKTEILINTLIKNDILFDYMPIDISRKAILFLIEKLQIYAEKRSFTSIQADYFEAIQWIKKERNAPALFLFIGSTIGNFTYKEAVNFLKKIKENTDNNDFFLIGFDLKKNIQKIYNAYNDKEGITSQFNLNILERLNRDFGANFKVNNFYHYPTYNPQTGSMESYLISSFEQLIKIPKFPLEFSLEQHEAIHLEYSKKYSVSEIELLCKESGFSLVQNFIEKKDMYLLSLWKSN